MMNYKENIEELRKAYVFFDRAGVKSEILNETISNLKDARNELCLACGAYRNSHLGACDTCRWRD